MYNFFEKDVDQKRLYLKDLFYSVKESNSTYSKLYELLSSNKKIGEDYLDRMYELVKKAKNQNNLDKKQDELNKLEKIHDLIKEIHEKEKLEKDQNIDSDLESKLLDL